MTGQPGVSGLEISGGAVIAVDLAGMRAVAVTLQACAADLVGLTGELGLARLSTLGGGALLDPGGHARSAAAVDGALRRLAVHDAQTGMLAARVRTAAVAYEHRDSEVARALGQLRDDFVHRVTPVAVAGAGLLGLRAAMTPAGARLLFKLGEGYVRRVLEVPLKNALDDLVEDHREGRLDADRVRERLGRLGGDMKDQLRSDAEEVVTDLLRWLTRNPAVAERLVAALPAMVSAVLAPSVGGVPVLGPTVPMGEWSVPPRDVEDLAFAALLIGTAVGVIGHGEVRVRPAVGAPPPPDRPAGSLQELVRRVAALSPGTSSSAAQVPVPAHRRGGSTPGSPPRPALEPEGGRIRIERVRGTDGVVRSVVHIPGTQDWDAGHGTNPMDMASNVALAAGLPAPSTEGVVLALRAAGVRADEPLLLVGHSQGGLTALHLANNPAFRQEFTPDAVLTAGSPTGSAPAPEGVKVLSLEHTDDLVPGLDNGPNQETESWTTVRRPVTAAEHGDAAVRQKMQTDPFAPHDDGAYARTASLADESDHPSLVDYKEHIDQYLHGEVLETSTSDWTAGREPVSRWAGPGTGCGR